MNRFSTLLIAITLISVAITPTASAQSTLFDGLRQGHPRVLVTPERVEELKALAQTDTLLAELVRVVHAYADSALEEPPIIYEFDQEGENNPRLKAQRRASMFRVFNCGMTYLLTGDTVYARRVRDDLMSAAAFPDWGPSHFLNIGEISCLMGVGYDWVYDYLTEQERSVIRRGILDHGLSQGILAYQGKQQNDWWVGQASNWNQVCSGGMALAALAIADHAPDTAEQIIRGATGSVPGAMTGYMPEGAWTEGPTYWAYGATYNGLLMSGLRTALDTLLGMEQADGYEALGKSGSFHIHTAGPTNLYFNYGDSKRTLYYSPVLFWLAREFGVPGYAWAERNICINDLPRMRKGGLMDDDTLDRFLALLLAWYSDAGRGITYGDFPLDATFTGENVAVGAFRSAWARDATYFGFKGGKPHARHSQMDIGSFVMDARGERWAWDLGYGNNKQPGFGDYSGERWTYLRNSNLGHNTLSFWGGLQNKDAYVPVREFYSEPDWAYATLDLTETYRTYAHSCIRKYWFPDRERIEITDEISPAFAPMEVRWAMVTTAEISLHGHQAILRQNGKEFRVIIHEPEGAEFSELSTRPEDPRPEEHLNEGTTMLAATLYREDESPFSVRVELNPVDTALESGGPVSWASGQRDAPVLLGPSPNPFHGQALFSFDLPVAERVTLTLFDLSGRKLDQLLHGWRPAGRNVIRYEGNHLPPGVYLLRLDHPGGSESLRVVRH